MGTSLAAGIAALSSRVEAALVMLADMPNVSREIVSKLLEAYSGEQKPITIPTYGGEVGPPTLFRRELFEELTRLRGEAGGRKLAQQSPHLTCYVAFAEEERPRDIDTPDDLRS
jgi:molybdenum cofactor cytidylyltransferase